MIVHSEGISYDQDFWEFSDYRNFDAKQEKWFFTWTIQKKCETFVRRVHGGKQPIATINFSSSLEIKTY